MKNRFLYMAFAVMMAVAATSCANDWTVGNPGDGIADEVLANFDSLNTVPALMQYNGITAYGATYGTGIVERGFVWSTGENPTLENSSMADASTGAGKYTAQITGLAAGTTYYIRPYAKTSDGTASYGSVRYTSTEAHLSATVSSVPDLTAITVNASVANGLPTLAVTERGIYWSASPDPAATGTKVMDSQAGRGSFTTVLNDMAMVTKFYIVAYAVSSEGTIYSPVHEVSTVEPTPAFFKNILNVTGLRYGVVRDKDGKFVARYAFNIGSDTDETQSTIDITYLSTEGNRDAQHVTRTVTYNDDYTQITWDAVSVGSLSFDGISRNGTTLDGLPGSTLSLDKPMPQNEILAMFTPSKYGGIQRTSNFTSGNHHGSIPTSLFNDIYLIEIKGDDPAGFITYVWSVNHWCYVNNAQNADGSPLMPQTDDKITFSFGSYNTGWGGDAAGYATSMEVIKPFTDIWYDPNGLIIVREEKEGKAVFGEAGTGGFYFYAISARNVGWVKVWLREWGQ